MKILKVAAIIIFALIFTLSFSYFLWCNFTPEGKQWQQERCSGPEASHVFQE